MWSIKNGVNGSLVVSLAHFTPTQEADVEDELDDPSERGAPRSATCNRHSKSAAAPANSDLLYGRREPHQPSVQLALPIPPPAGPTMVSQRDLLRRSSEYRMRRI